MAIDWAKVRSAMTNTPDYNPGAWGGAGQHYSNVPGYKGSAYGQNQGNQWMRNFGSRPQAGGGADYMSTIGTPNRVKTIPTADPNAWSQARYEMTRPDAYGMDEEELAQKGGVWDAAKAAGSKFTTPLFEMGKKVLGGVGDMAEGISRGSRLHKAFKDKYGGSGEWKAAKAAMMTPEDQAFYDKYMRLADMAQDNQKAQEYRDIAETAWRNQQTTDRLAQTMGFEGYNDPKYIDERYTGGRRKGQFVPGVERMANNPYIQSLMAAGTERPVGLQYDDPDMLNEILPGEPGVDLRPYAGMESGIDYDAMGLAPDPENDLLYGEPGFGAQKIKPKMKPDRYNPYRDEDYGAPIWPVDPYEGIYESPLTDLLYGEELVDATPERPLHSRHEFLPRDTVAITGMGGGMNAFPEQGWWDWILGRDPDIDITEDIR
jgi:hypothetical protein